MKKINQILVIAFLMTFAINASATGGEINKIFPAKEKIKIRTAGGNLKIIKGSADKIIVNIIHTFNEDDIEFDFNECDDRLYFTESYSCHVCSGESDWTVTVPENTKITFNSSSGNFEIENNTGELDIRLSCGDIDVKQFSGDVELKTSSGKVQLDNVEGDIEVYCSSGDINAENIKGDFDFKASSGDIKIENGEGVFYIYASGGDLDVNNITTKSSSVFRTSSGDAVVTLRQTLKNNISVRSSSGDAILDFNGNKICGIVEMTYKHKRGKIKCPVKFEKEESDEFSGLSLKNIEISPSTIITKSFKRTNDTPLIKIKTSTGTAKLIE